MLGQINMNIEFHNHDGINTPKINQRDIEGALVDSDLVHITGDETVAGVKTLTSIPVLPASDPTEDNQAVRKSYMDGLLPGFEVIPSETIRDEANDYAYTNESSYTKLKEIKFNEVSGKIRVVFRLGGGAADGDRHGRIYINGSAVGTERINSGAVDIDYTEDIDVEKDDLVQIYAYDGTSDLSYVSLFKLKYDKVFAVTPGTVNDN